MSSTKFNIKTYTPHTIYGFSTKVYEKKTLYLIQIITCQATIFKRPSKDYANFIS